MGTDDLPYLFFAGRAMGRAKIMAGMSEEKEKKGKSGAGAI